ncbi:MAG: hypothetical protein F8N38_00160 [Hungatella sp.]|nr:hypothetical protein [Hungatella sp.]
MTEEEFENKKRDIIDKM